MSTKYVTSNLIGPSLQSNWSNYGLANQLFQVATVLSYAIDNDLQAVFPDLNDTNKQGNYKDNIFRNLSLDNPKVSKYATYTEGSFTFSPIPKFEDHPMILLKDSYFQSEKYFVHNRDAILDILDPSEDDMSYINDKYGKLLKNSSSCHIRRGDYIKLKQCHAPLYETDYYEKALSEMSSENILLFTDDLSWCKENFNDPRITFVEGEEDYMDIYIMSMCEHNIIANSSFSWWGAWLNTNPNKKVIAPKSWFGPACSHDISNLVPSEWIRL